MAESNKLITPLYSTAKANEAIHLGCETLYISCDRHGFTCRGRATFRLQPRLRFTIDAQLSKQPMDVLRIIATSGPIRMQYGLNKAPVNVRMAEGTTGISPDGATGAATFFPDPEHLTVCRDRRPRLTAVTFHVMNFPAFLSQGDRGNDLLHQGRRLGRVFLEHEGWRVELQQLPEAKNLIKQLRAEGGFAITHVGRLTRTNGKTFWISQAETILGDLHQFLSFARGLWVPLVLPVGEDKAGNRVFEEWGCRLATGWEPRLSWFDDHNGQVLSELYPGFIDLLNDGCLGEAAKVALYWYLRSNRAGEGAGVDSGIILSQAALERLTVAYLSHSGQSTDGRAAERFRRTFSGLKLPTSIPRKMAPLSTAARKCGWTDLPEAIVKVRNELVHPKDRLPIRIGKVVTPVWQVAQWYIELLILALAGYRGVYSNRLRARWRGEVERVPWAK